VSDRPILFSAPMVRALLAGTKTQTRRVLKPQPHFANVWQDEDTLDWWQSGHGEADDDPIHIRIQRGDALWVREAWRAFAGMDGTKPRDLWAPGCGHGAGVLYEADCDGLALTKEGERWTGARTEHRNAFGKLRPSMFMPRWASRLTLAVTDVRVQRLQDISEEDARSEGALVEYGEGANISERRAFNLIWEHINGAGSWAANPWVTATTFAVERRNIDGEG